MGQAERLLTPQSQQINAPVSATASSTGTATFTFQAPPQGLVWTGTLTCAGAPATAVFLANIGATSWGDWAGSSVYGPVQALASQSLVVTATGLTPGTSYELVWAGSSDAAESVQPIWPDTNVSAQEVLFGAGTLILAPQSIVPTAGAITVAPIVPPNVRTLVISLQHLAPLDPIVVTNVSVVGGTTGNQFYNAPPYLTVGPAAGPQSTNALIVIPFIGLLDKGVTITITTTQTLVVQAFGDTAQYDESVFYNGVAIAASQIANNNTVTILTGPARLLTANLDLQAAGFAGLINLNGVPILRSDAVAAAGQSVALSFPPNTILPAGQTVTVQSTAADNAIGSISYAYP